MAITTVKPFYIDIDGVYRPIDSDPVNGNKIAVAELQVTKDAAANKTLVMDALGNLAPALIANANIDANAAIADTKLDTISTANKVASSANVDLAAATNANTASTLVKRDSSGNFSAGVITAALTGNVAGNVTGNLTGNSNGVHTGNVAGNVTGNVTGDVTGNLTGNSAGTHTGSVIGNVTGNVSGNAGTATTAGTAGQLTTARNIALSGDVSGDANFDGSANIDIIVSVDSVGDGALSPNVALYDAVAPAFTAKLGVGTPVDADTTKAATVGYVIGKVNAAISGIDYKQECQVYFGLGSTGPVQSIASIVALMNGTTGVFTNNTRALVNFDLANVESGIYDITGSDGAWAMARSSDMATGSDAAGAYTFCLQQFEGQTETLEPYNTAMICQQTKGNAVVGTNTLTFAVYGVGISYSFDAPLSESNGAVSLNFDSTLDTPGGILGVVGVPLGFKIGPTSTSNAVTAANVNTLVNGVNGDATALHRHQSTLAQYPVASAITAGKVITADNGNAVVASKTNGKVMGIVYDSTASAANIATSGIANITAPAGSPSQGDNLYINTNGDLCTYGTLIGGDFATKVGKYMGPSGPSGAHQIAIAIQEFGIKP